MPPSPIVRALLSTARITGVAGLGLTAAACTKSTPAPAPATPVHAEPAEGPSPLDVSADTDADTSLETCQGVWTSEGIDTLDYNAFAERMMEESRPEASAAAVACCLANHPEEPRWGCCAIEPELQAMACTPWGPPAPPSMT